MTVQASNQDIFVLEVHQRQLILELIEVMDFILMLKRLHERHNEETD